MTTKALYDHIGIRYATRRQPDPRIEALIHAALGSCKSVLNVGAGSGSYEPKDRFTVAVEPSIEMILQRAKGSAPVIQATANRLPIRDKSFDSALAILTIHHWQDRRQGLAELRRIARERVVILTWDPEHPGFWLTQQYFPEILDIDRPAFPFVSEIESVIGPVESRVVPVPADCRDGFFGAYWKRPEQYLDPSVRAAISIFSKFDNEPGLAKLRRDLDDGTWHAKNASLQTLQELDIGYRLVVARPARP